MCYDYDTIELIFQTKINTCDERKNIYFFLLFPKMELVYSHRVYCDLFIIKMQIFIIFVQNKKMSLIKRIEF